MRVLFINRFFHPDQSATAQLLTELTEDLDGFGASVTVITGRVDYLGNGTLLPPRGMHKGIEIRRVRSTNFDRGGFFGRFLDYISFYVAAGWTALWCKPYDCLVVLSDPPLLSVLAVLLRSLKRCRAVCWLQDVFPEIAVRAGVLPEGVVARILRRLAIWSLQHVDRTVVIGRCMERHLQARGVSPDKLQLVPNWADGSLIQPVNRKENWFLDKHGLDQQFVVMYSGNFGIVHEFETIDTMVRALKSEKKIRFCFIGKGSHRDKLAGLARTERWDHVMFLPYQEREMMRMALPGGDVHLVSLRTDMCGLSVPSKLYGIMASARPIIFIGPEESEAAAVIREADCGFVIAPGRADKAVEALLTYVHDADLVERHGKNGRACLERNYDRRVLTRQFWNRFEERSNNLT